MKQISMISFIIFILICPFLVGLFEDWVFYKFTRDKYEMTLK